jgi:hypothetical protein
MRTAWARLSVGWTGEHGMVTRRLARVKERHVPAPVPRRGGADHAPERGERLGEARLALAGVEDVLRPDREGGGDPADLRRRLDQDQPVEAHVRHGPRRGPDVAFLPGADEDHGHAHDPELYRFLTAPSPEG